MRRHRSWVLVGALVGSAAVACGPVVTVDPSGTTSSSGGEGGTTASSGTTATGAQGGATTGTGGTTTDTGGTGGTTASGGCVDPQTDCSGDPGPCNTWACDGSMECVPSPVPDGTLLPPQTQIAGDCQTNACVAGEPSSIADDSDVPDDANACTADACTNGIPTHFPVPVGTPCGFGGGYCDGTGLCANCLDLVCPDGMECDPATITCIFIDCFNGILDGAETDVDCGSPDCAKCTDGQGCLDAASCQSNHCVASLCAAGTCMDGIFNNAELGESDVDCGGPVCEKCLSGKACKLNTDCQSGNCALSMCQ